MSKSVKDSLEITQRCKKYPKIIYIYLYFYGRALDASKLDLDASKRAPENLDPKTRTLGLTPIIFCKVGAPKTDKQVSGDPQFFFI